MNTLGEVVNIIDEQFKAVDVKNVDSKNRISLGEKILKVLKKADAFKIFIGRDGDILLRPMVNIPMKEAWVYKNPKVLKQIRQGLTEAKKGNVKEVKELDAFFESL